MDEAVQFSAGSRRQSDYIKALALKAGFATPLDACGSVLGMEATTLLQSPPDTTQARKVIDALKGMVDSKKSAPDTKPEQAAHQPPSNEASRDTTPSKLRAHAAAREIPSGLDSDSTFIIKALIQHEVVRAVMSGEQLTLPRPRSNGGANGNKRIEMDHLLKFFRNWDELADAFGVTVPTAKAWGTYVPDSRVFEAEVRTNGYVRVPRDRDGEVVA